MFLILSSQRPCEEVGRLLLSVLFRRGNRTQSGRAGPGSRGHSQARCLYPRAGGTDGTLRRSSAAGFPTGARVLGDAHSGRPGGFLGTITTFQVPPLQQRAGDTPEPGGSQVLERTGVHLRSAHPTAAMGPVLRVAGGGCSRLSLGSPHRNPVSKGEVGKDPPRLVPPSPLKR